MHLGDEELVPWVLHKLARHGWWGAKHTSIDNVPKGAPKHAWSRIKETVKLLIKEGYIIPKPTGYGLEISLNFNKKEEIFRIIEEWKKD